MIKYLSKLEPLAMSAMLYIYPISVFAHTPYQSILIFESILALPVILGSYFIGKGKRVVFIMIGFVLLMVSNYLVVKEINDYIFWIAVSLPFLLLVISIIIYLKQKNIHIVSEVNPESDKYKTEDVTLKELK